MMTHRGYHQWLRQNTAGWLALLLLLGGCSVRDIEPFSVRDGSLPDVGAPDVGVPDVDPLQESWEVDKQALEAWRPQGADPQDELGLLWMSRFWLMPNPIVLAINPGGSPISCGFVESGSIGTDPLSLTSVYVEGPISQPDFLPLPLPYVLSDGGDGNSNGFGGDVCATGPVAPGYVGDVVFLSDDPKTPEIRVAVVAMNTEDIPYEMYPFTLASYHSRFHFAPNPVRLEHAAGEATIEVVAALVGEEPVTLLGVDTLGPDTTVVGVTIDGMPAWNGDFPVGFPPDDPGWSAHDHVRVTLRYAPTGTTPLDDALLVAFDDGDLESYRVVVPIMVR